MSEPPIVSINPPINEPVMRLKMRHFTSGAFQVLCSLSAWVGIVALTVMLIVIFQMSQGSLDWKFLTSFDSASPNRTGILVGIWGTFWLMMMTSCIAIPVGVAAAVYLEEYARKTWLTSLIQLNISNLAGVPSIVYGMLGLTIFVRYMQMGNNLLSASLTLSILILPIIIISTQEALRSVPQSIRHASLALGATKWQTIWSQVLPASVPGIMTGVILSVSRAIGESAPLIVLGAVTYIGQTPGKIETIPQLIQNPAAIAQVPTSSYTVLPLQIYNYAALQAKSAFRHEAAAAIIVLLVILLLMSSIAIFIRHRFQKNLKW